MSKYIKKEIYKRKKYTPEGDLVPTYVLENIDVFVDKDGFMVLKGRTPIGKSTINKYYELKETIDLTTSTPKVHPISNEIGSGDGGSTAGENAYNKR